jgi:paraquat-inducible protein A
MVEGCCECPSCGLMQRLPTMRVARVAECQRCGAHLRRTRPAVGLDGTLVFAICSALLFVLCCLTPIMELNVYGREREVSLFTGPIEMAREGFVLTGTLVAIATLAMPALSIALMLFVQLRIRAQDFGPRVGEAMRLYEKIRPWSMIEVYMLGIFVAYTKLVDLATVNLNVAVYALAALMLTQAATDSALDAHLVWARIGQTRGLASDACRVADVDPPPADDLERTMQAGLTLGDAHYFCGCDGCGALLCDRLPDDPVDRPFDDKAPYRCPRCDVALEHRRSNPQVRAVALLLAAIALYVPANVLPVMQTYKLQSGGGHTILHGAIELWQDGMWPLALLVLFASITVPVLKIGALLWMTIATILGTPRGLVGRTKLYRVVVIIGRWSMIDVFMISILVAVVRYGALANIKALPGVACFAAVVVLTIFAADLFDPRRMWDVAGYNAAELRRPPMARQWHKRAAAIRAELRARGKLRTKRNVSV